MGQTTFGTVIGVGMDQVFNEASLSASLADKYAALDSLWILSKTTTRLAKLGFSRQIRVTEDFETRYLAPDYTIGEYLHSPLDGRNRTVQSLLRGRFSSFPYVENLCKEQGVTELDDYHIEGERCKGLALAALLGVPALSLSGDPRFIPPDTIITHDTLHATGQAVDEIQSVTHRVALVCEEGDIDCHEARILETLHSPLCDGACVLEHASRFFPYLVFSKTAQMQIEGITRENILFLRIRTILLELNRAMAEVENNSALFSPQGFKFSPAESDTATTGRKGQKHTFTFDNKEILCEAHMRITDSDRIYFKGVPCEFKVYIGHIGKHLPTKHYG